MNTQICNIRRKELDNLKSFLHLAHNITLKGLVGKVSPYLPAQWWWQGVKKLPSFFSIPGRITYLLPPLRLKNLKSLRGRGVHVLSFQQHAKLSVCCSLSGRVSCLALHLSGSETSQTLRLFNLAQSAEFLPVTLKVILFIFFSK